jgi:hypothetical protein
MVEPEYKHIENNKNEFLYVNKDILRDQDELRELKE